MREYLGIPDKMRVCLVYQQLDFDTSRQICFLLLNFFLGEGPFFFCLFVCFCLLYLFTYLISHASNTFISFIDLAFDRFNFFEDNDGLSGWKNLVGT